MKKSLTIAANLRKAYNAVFPGALGSLGGMPRNLLVRSDVFVFRHLSKEPTAHISTLGKASRVAIARGSIPRWYQ